MSMYYEIIVKQIISQLVVCFFVLLAQTAQSSPLSHHKNYSDLLKPIVEYESLKSKFNSLDDKTIEAFINENDAVYVSNLMKKKWLRRLAKQKDWQRFEKYYDDSVNSIQLECYHLNRRIRASGISSTMDERIRELWLTRRSRPSSCTSVFKRWRKAGKMSDELFWKRIKLIIEKNKRPNKDKRAHSLAKTHLPSKQRIWIDHWVAVHKNPVDELSKPQFSLDSEHSVRVILYGLERIARKDPSKAEHIWKALRKKILLAKKIQAGGLCGHRLSCGYQPPPEREQMAA